MSTWREVALGDVIEVHDHRRVPLSAAERRTRRGPYPYYGAQGVIDHIDDYLFDGRYILIPEDGENLRSRKLPIAYFAEGKFWVNNHAHIVRARDGVAVDRFIQSALQASDISGFITGAAQPKLSQANLLRIPLRVPDIEGQRRIASVLDAIDDLIENNRRRIALLEQLAQAIYREWFAHFRFPGHEKAKMVDSELGQIPQGWTVTSLDSVCELVKTNFDESKHSALPLLDMARMQRGTLSVGELGVADELSTSRILFNEDDVLFGSIRPYLHKVALAPRSGVTNTSVLVLRPVRAQVVSLLPVLCSSHQTIEWATQHAAGTKMPVIKWDVLRSLPLVLPDSKTLERFDAQARPALEFIKAASRLNRKLRTTRDLLLPRLVTGAIDVSRLDLDALLEESAR
jgi:type I restriction enzyme S subunit